MRGASLVYNGIGIGLTRTNSVSSRPVMTEDGLDYLWTEYVVDVSGVINVAETAYALNNNNGVDPSPGNLPSDTYNVISGLLKTVGGELYFRNFGNFLFNNDTVNGVINDINNGPFPQELRITRIDGGAVFHINYSIKFSINECYPAQDTYKGAFRSNRFTQEQTIDPDFYTHLTTRGAAYFRVDVLDDAEQVADDFRYLLLPMIPFGFRRGAINFRVSPARNIIYYECVDDEMPYELGDTGGAGTGNLARTYITRANGVYSQSTVPFEKGIPCGQQNAFCMIELWGSKRANVWTLTQYAYALAASTVNLSDPDKAYIRAQSFEKSLTERYVKITLNVYMMPISKGESSNFGLHRDDNLKKIGPFAPGASEVNAFGMNPTPPGDNGTRGTANLRLLTAALTLACGTPPDVPCPSATEVDTGNVHYTGGDVPSSNLYCGPPTVTVSEARDPVTPTYSRTSGTSGFTSAEISTRYETHNGMIQCPLASRASTQSDSGGSTPQPEDTPSCSVMNIYQPMTTRITKWTCERIKQPPNIPALVSNSKNEVLLRSQIDMMDVALLDDGQTKVFRVSGHYEHALKRDIGLIPDLSYPVTEWVDFAYGDDRIVFNDNESHGMIDPVSSDSDPVPDPFV